MHRTAFLPTGLLVFIFVIAKSLIVRRHPISAVSLSNLVAVTAEDVAIALLMGALAATALFATARRPRLHRFAWFGIMALSALAGVYAMVNVGIFNTLGYPLNARMFALAGRITDLRSSFAAHLDRSLAIGMVGAVAAFAVASHRRFSLTPSRGPRVAFCAIAVAWIGCGMIFRAQAEPDSWVRRAAPNAHREMLFSLTSRLLFDRRAELVTPFSPDYLDDFRPAAQRRHPALARFASPPRNVLMIVLESTAAKYMSLYGAPYDTTPNLVAESRHAVVFERAYAQVGYTFASRMPLFYSVYPGLPWAYSPLDGQRMPPGMGAILKQRGYRTAFFSAAEPEWDSVTYIAQDAGLAEVLGPAELGGRMASSWGTEDGVLIDGLIKWIDADRTRPFFAIAWTDQTHDPYTLSADTTPVDFLAGANPPHAENFNRYLNAVRQADRHLGRLFAALRERNLADDTLVVITGDHGEAFGDPHEVLGHGGGLFEENLRVPLMFWNPRLFPTGERLQQVGGHVDVNPTLAQILDIQPPANWQGASLFSPDHPGRVYLLADLSGYQFGVTDDRYKYIHHFTGGFERLYDLRQDPLEQRDVSAQQPEITSSLRARVSAFVHAEQAFLKAAVPGKH
jgi:phosphoglycerol transferase MdoB-like AlkP superfamily enzyme